MLVPLLQDVLEGISISDSSNFIEIDFKEQIQEQMPDWNIEVWDADEFNEDLVSVVADHIINEYENGMNNVQHCSWTTNNSDTYYYVVASKKD